MCPVLFSIGPVNIYGYGLMIALAAIAATATAMFRAKRAGLSSDTVFNIAIICGGLGIVGAKLLYIIVEFKDFLKDPVDVLTGGGLVVYGGVIIGVLIGYFYTRKKPGGFFRYFDIVMPSIAIGQGIGRFGCLFAGCCYGMHWDSPISLVFPEGSYAPAGVPLFPSQIVSALGDFAIAIILIILAKKIKTKGMIGSLYVLMYAVGRFVLEFFRSDNRGSIGPLSTSQFIAIIMAAVAVGLIILVNKLNRKDDGDAVDGGETSL